MTVVPPLSPGDEADALAARQKRAGPLKYWLELMIVLVPLVLIVAVLCRYRSHHGFLVVRHAVRNKTRLMRDDVKFALAGSLDQTFPAGTDVSSLTTSRDLPAGSPLRWSDVERLQPAAMTSINAAEVLSDKNTALKMSPYDPIALQLLPATKRATRLILKETTLHADMVAGVPLPPTVPPPPKAWACEVELPLHVFVGPMRPAVASKVTLLVRRKEGGVLTASARVLALDATRDPAAIIVAVTPVTAKRIVSTAPSEIFLTRAGGH